MLILECQKFTIAKKKNREGICDVRTNDAWIRLGAQMAMGHHLMLAWY